MKEPIYPVRAHRYAEATGTRLRISFEPLA